MKNKNIMFVKERYDRNNNLKLELHCSGKDSLTKKYKVYVKTYSVPDNIKSKKEIEKFSLQCQIEWKNEVDKLSKGICYIDNDIKFCDYAEKYVEDILKYNKDSYNYYSSCLANLKILKEKFGLYTLKEMNLAVIKKFCDWLCERTYKKEIVTVKDDLKKIIKEKGMTLTKTAKESGISSTTLKVALNIGNKVDKLTAKKICDYLEIPIDKFFKIECLNVPYSKDANRNLKTLLKGILQEAVRNGLIEVNYASSGYTKPVGGSKKEKEIYSSKEEIKEFLMCLDKEEDIRKKVAFSVGIYLGLRGAEISGLEWKDIDFDKNTLSINKNTMYIYGFGVITKGTKNESSARVISLPNNFVKLLKEYKIWWDNEKFLHGDLWLNTDRLFVRNDGKDMPNATIASWLKEFQEKNSLKRVTLHGLRHTNITMLIANGVDIKTVSARVGHSDIKTTLNIYAHYVKESDEKASQLIDKLLA